MNDISRAKAFCIEWTWCVGCKHCWRYETQYPCSECLSKSIGPNGPVNYEKEDNNGNG